MSDNPYAPPSADVDAPVGGPVEGSGSFLVGQCFSDAWAATWANLPLWLGVAVVASLLMGASAITVIGGFVVAPLLAYGGVRFMLNVHDGCAAFADLWSGFREQPVSIVLRGLALMFLTLVVLYVGQIPLLIGTFTESMTLMGVGQIINIVWAFVVVRFYMAFFLWVEMGLGPIEALGRSWTMTAPVKWKMMGLAIVASLLVIVPVGLAMAMMVPGIASESPLWIMVGAIAMFVLMVPAMMVSSLLYVSAYRQMAGRPEAAS